MPPKPPGNRPSTANVTPLRREGPLKPAPRHGVTLGFGIDLTADGTLIIRFPDGSIERIRGLIEPNEDSKRAAHEASTRSGVKRAPRSRARSARAFPSAGARRIRA